MNPQQMNISKNLSEAYDRNYEVLRRLGMEQIEKLSGRVWTDYNIHDPGVTTLELLCYALTDLGYRADHPLEDLLAAPENNRQAMHRQFASARNILTTCPLTENDYRKLLIDLDGVRNAWLLSNTEKMLYLDCKGKRREDADSFGLLAWQEIGTPENRKFFALQGLYDVLVDFEPAVQKIGDETERKAAKADILQQVRQTFHRHRSLCEDLVNVREVPLEEVKFCMEIELQPGAMAHQVYAEILFALHRYLNPRVQFYALGEMLQKPLPDGSPRTVDQVFDTPVLQHGFIDDEELHASGLCREARASDLMAIIMNIEGVKLIREFFMARTGGNFESDSAWLLTFYGDSLPSLNEAQTVINFFKSGLPVVASQAKTEARYNKKLQAAAVENKQMDDLPMPLGQYRPLASYRSIQLDFPDTYGINAAGLPATASRQRKAQALQLKGYLLFFDQLIALYMQHLASMGQLLAPDDSDRRTCFAQGVHDVPGVEKLTGDRPRREAVAAQITAGLDNYHERKNRFLDHLIARYAERFGDYAFLMRELFGEGAEDLIIRHKVKFLESYPRDSACRSGGPDYYNLPEDPAATATEGLWDTENVSGLQRRVGRLAGIRDHRRRDLTASPYQFDPQTDGEGVETWGWTVNSEDGPPLVQGIERFSSEKEAREALWLAVMAGAAGGNYRAVPTVADPQKFELLIGGEDTPRGRVLQTFDSPEEAMAEAPALEDYLYQQVTEEGLYLVEHILLRPPEQPVPDPLLFLPVCVDADCHSCDPVDPYSFRVSVILPGYTSRLGNMDFRKFMDRLIRTEMPAHVLPRICFVGREDLGGFEKCYRQWLVAHRQWQHLNDTEKETAYEGYRQKLQGMVDCLNRVHTIYPEGTLSDCSDTEANKIILNRTNLGTLNQKENGNDTV